MSHSSSQITPFPSYSIQKEKHKNQIFRLKSLSRLAPVLILNFLWTDMPFCKHKKKSRCKNVCQDCKYTVPIIEIPQSSQEISHFRVIKETVFLCLKAKFQDLQNPQSLFLLHQRSLKCSIRLIFMWHKAGRGTAIWI